MELGEKLKTLRVAKKMTQEQISELSGITLTTISKYELGTRKPKQEQLKKLAKALGISAHALTNIEIKTLSDLSSLIFAMEDHANAYFAAESDEDGNYIPDTFCIKFHDRMVNDKFCSYLNALNLLEGQEIAELKNTMLDDTTPIQKPSQIEVAGPTPEMDGIANIANKKELQNILLECSPKKIDLMLKVCRQIKDCNM